MKYYISEYWAMTNSADPQERENGQNKWNETAKKYGPYFEAIKDKLSKKFLKEFNKTNWFHDFSFDSINISNSGKFVSTVQFSISLDGCCVHNNIVRSKRASN